MSQKKKKFPPLRLQPGQVIECWTVLEEIRGERSGLHYQCRCICGVERPVSASRLRQGGSKSCGCLSKNFPKITEEEKQPLTPAVQRQLRLIVQGYLPPADQFTQLESAPCWTLESFCKLLGLGLDEFEKHILAGDNRFRASP